MITSCEQNYNITLCDWCLDIFQLTSLHKPQMIHKNQWLLAEQYFTKVAGDRQCNVILLKTRVAEQIVLLLYF